MELGEERESKAEPGRAVCSWKPLGFSAKMSQARRRGCQACAQRQGRKQKAPAQAFQMALRSQPHCDKGPALQGSRCSEPFC